MSNEALRGPPHVRVLGSIEVGSSTLGLRVRRLLAALLARLQRLLRRPWLWAFEGCHLDRHTADSIRAAGFASVELERYRLRSVFWTVNEQVAGTAWAGVS